MKKYTLPKKILEKNNDEKVMKTFRLDPNTLEDLEGIAKANNITQTEVVKIAINNLVNTEK